MNWWSYLSYRWRIAMKKKTNKKNKQKECSLIFFSSDPSNIVKPQKSAHVVPRCLCAFSIDIVVGLGICEKKIYHSEHVLRCLPVFRCAIDVQKVINLEIFDHRSMQAIQYLGIKWMKRWSVKCQSISPVNSINDAEWWNYMCTNLFDLRTKIYFDFLLRFHQYLHVNRDNDW